jgi:hypothetical protein
MTPGRQMAHSPGVTDPWHCCQLTAVQPDHKLFVGLGFPGRHGASANPGAFCFQDGNTFNPYPTILPKPLFRNFGSMIS